MITSRQLINELEALQGAQVSYFGDVHTLNNVVTSEDLTIDTLDIIRGLDAYEVDAGAFELYNEEADAYEVPSDILSAWDVDAWDADFEFMDTLETYGFLGEEIQANNTYNWCAPVNHDFDFKVFKDVFCGGVYVFLQVHKFGDVRGNYAGFVLYHFDSIDEFFEVVSDNGGYKYISLDVDGVGYDVALSVWGDSYEVWDVDGGYICDAYGDIEDVTAKIREAIA